MSEEAWLLIRGVDSSLWSHHIQSDRQILGRALDCEISMAHSTVSRQHAEIWKHDDRFHIRDLGSSNGTFLNGVRITESQIEIGDAIQLGQVTLEVVAGSEHHASRNPDSTLIGAGERGAADESVAGDLSAGQQQVLQLLLRGLSEKQVASSLCLSPHTVHTHIKQIYKALGVRSRGALMAKLMKKTQEVKLDRGPIGPHTPDAQASE